MTTQAREGATLEQRTQATKYLTASGNFYGGTSNWYKYGFPFINTIYTDGVKVACDTLGGWWMVNIICSYLDKKYIQWLIDKNQFPLFARFTVTKNGGFVFDLEGYDPENGETIILKSQKGGFTDLAVNMIHFKIGYNGNGLDYVICMPQED